MGLILKRFGIAALVVGALYATIFRAMGIPADHHYVTEGRPFYVTKDGKGKAIEAMFA